MTARSDQLPLKGTEGPPRAAVTHTVSGVVLVNVWLKCPTCGDTVPVELRVMGDGLVRNQPRCSPCRSR